MIELNMKISASVYHLKIAINLVLCQFLLTTTQPLPAEMPASPVSPKESLSHFQVHPDCEVRLAASEPQVVDPVAIRFDQHGRMWVVEMRDYPLGPGEGQKPSSKIKILEDRDGDGFFESSMTFADQLLFATGLQPWQDGAFVTVAGQILFLRDTDGDGKSDVREVWYEGFAEQNSQLRANHPTLSMDGLIYVANGLRGGKIRDVKNGGKEIDISGMDFAFDPHTGACRTVSGTGQFGLTFDAVGNRFVCSNRNPLTQIVIEDRYMQKTPNTRLSSVKQDAAVAGGESRVYPISNAWTTSNLHAGQFTAACGVKIFGGDALGADFQGNAFTCEPTGSLVHRERFDAKPGPALKTAPASESVEFLASTDSWFRPVNLANGPDGSLYVVDMYRAVIEHPEWMPDELKTRPDLLLGNDRGRIYRVVRSGSTPPSIAKFDSKSLVENLDDPGQWNVETAFRLLYEQTRTDEENPGLKASLENLLGDSTHKWASIRALWSLKISGLLEQTHVDTALQSGNRQLVRQAMIVGETLIGDRDVSPAERGKLPDSIGQFINSNDPELRFQAALSSLYYKKPESWPEQLAQSYLSAEGTRWVENALTMAAGGKSDSILKTLVASQKQRLMNSPKHPSELLNRLTNHASPGAAILAMTKILDDRFTNGLSQSATIVSEVRLSLLIDTVRAARRNGVNPGDFEMTFQANASPSSIRNRLSFLDELRTRLVDENIVAYERIEAVDVLSYFESDRGQIARLALNEALPEVRVAAIASLNGVADSETWSSLMSNFAEQSPAIRRQIVAAATNDNSVARILLAAIKTGDVAPGEIARPARQKLIDSADPEVSRLARQKLANVIKSDRAEVLARYQVAAGREGDAQVGKQLFSKHCATCHRFGELGQDVGPDISDTRTRTKQQLLNDIINPNGAIDANYISYTVLTFDGKSHAGVIASENAANITLKMAEGKTESLLRSEIEEMATTGQSLMPEGFEQDISVQDMTDLLSYLKNWRYLDGAVPLNEQAKGPVK